MPITMPDLSPITKELNFVIDEIIKLKEKHSIGNKIHQCIAILESLKKLQLQSFSTHPITFEQEQNFDLCITLLFEIGHEYRFEIAGSIYCILEHIKCKHYQESAEAIVKLDTTCPWKIIKGLKIQMIKKYLSYDLHRKIKNRPKLISDEIKLIDIINEGIKFLDDFCKVFAIGTLIPVQNEKLYAELNSFLEGLWQSKRYRTRGGPQICDDIHKYKLHLYEIFLSLQKILIRNNLDSIKSIEIGPKESDLTKSIKTDPKREITSFKSVDKSEVSYEIKSKTEFSTIDRLEEILIPPQNLNQTIARIDNEELFVTILLSDISHLKKLLEKHDNSSRKKYINSPYTEAFDLSNEIECTIYKINPKQERMDNDAHAFASLFKSDNCHLNNVTPLMLAAILGNKAIIEFLLQQGATIDVRNCHGYDSFYYAYLHTKITENTGPLETFLSMGADINTVYYTLPFSKNVHSTKIVQVDFGTILMCAIRARNLLLANKIVSLGANVNQPSIKGLTPLKMLFEIPYFWARGKFGRFSSDIEESKKIRDWNETMATLLISKGANPKIKTGLDIRKLTKEDRKRVEQELGVETLEDVIKSKSKETNIQDILDLMKESDLAIGIFPLTALAVGVKNSPISSDVADTKTSVEQRALVTQSAAINVAVNKNLLPDENCEKNALIFSDLNASSASKEQVIVPHLFEPSEIIHNKNGDTLRFWV